MITRHKWRDAGTDYYKIGSYKVSEFDVMRFWELMCGEKKIKAFLANCEKETDGSMVPQVKGRQHVTETIVADGTTYLAYCSEHGRMCRFWRSGKYA
jgi:hypothetical protein